MLLLAPTIAYWPTTFHDFGLRDDYSSLREAHEEPGKILQFCASHARPVYGWLLQASYGQTSSVQNLHWMRCLAALLLGVISLVSFRSLRSLGWSFYTSLSFALLIAVIPSSQVIASWAIGWPYAAAALLAIGGFFAAEGAMTVMRNAAGRQGMKSRRFGMAQWCVALGLMLVSALIYQPSALFYLVPMTAALIARRDLTLAQAARWTVSHLGLVCLSLVMAYGTMSALYMRGVFEKSDRIAFEQHWVAKIAWFLAEPLPNALSLLVLNDDHYRNHALYMGCAGIVGLVLLAGAYLQWQRFGRTRGMIWLTGLLGLPVFACAVSLIASERYATYRTILAMTAVLLCFLVASVSALATNLSDRTRKILASLAIAVAFLCAQHHVYALIAVPQGHEWHLMENGARQLRIDRPHRRVFAIASTEADISTPTVYHDEFGSLSSNSEWVPREMFKRAMHDLHPNVPNLDARYDFATGPKLPSGQHYDVIIDMHRLRRFYTEDGF